MLALVFSSGTTHSVLGSAVIVAPCIAVGAYHTLKSLLPKIRSGKITVTGIGIGSHGAQIWKVRCVNPVERTDICFMNLQLISGVPPTRKIYQATVTTRLPAIGETLVMAGFRAGDQAYEQIAPETLEIRGAMRLTSGIVTQSFPLGRDRSIVIWPSLEVDAPLFGGMSGGPVFDARGGLIGLGSRSMEFGAGEEPSPMIVALLWPALGVPFPIDQDSGESISLLELDGRYTAIENPAAVAISRNGQDVITTYAPWT